MSNEAMQYVAVRMPSELVEEIDGLVSVLGGNRSEFIRLAADERIVKLRPLLVTLADAGVDGAGFDKLSQRERDEVTE